MSDLYAENSLTQMPAEKLVANVSATSGMARLFGRILSMRRNQPDALIGFQTSPSSEASPT